MEKSVQLLFTREIMEYGVKMFELEPSSLHKLGEFENYIYEGKYKNIDVILRYTHSSHRNEEQIHSEIDWVQFLKQEKVNVYHHFYSKNQNLLESMVANDGSTFYICCYEKLPGIRLNLQDFKNNPEYIKKWGSVIGLLHKKTKGYMPSKNISKRVEWFEDDALRCNDYHNNADSSFFEYSSSIIRKIELLPKDTSNYGLIHSDLHSGNFTLSDGQLYIFDFDDCSYHWFASDIAIPLYYTVLQRLYEETEGTDEFATFFMEHFLTGYREHHYISSESIKTIPLFLQLRDVVLLSVMYKKFDLENMSAVEERLFTSVNERMKNRNVIAHVDWSKL